MNVLPVANSYLELAPDTPAGRPLRAPHRQRPQAFHAAFDRKTLFYDCFRHADGQRVLLVGPPLGGFGPIGFSAGGVALKARTYASLSTATTELIGASASATAIRVAVAGETHELAIQPSGVAALAGKRLLFSINRDNELGWVREWAGWHARLHGTDAVILFDNGSQTYSRDELLETLRGVPGLAHVGVPSWPYRFGPIDPAVRRDPYWTRFLQIGSMSVVLRRYGEAAYGLLDCDVDELAGTHSGASIYDLARQSRGGLVAFRGRWIEAVRAGTGPARHRDFAMTAPGERGFSRTRKWALDPSRSWVRRLNVHPYWHWIAGRPPFSKSMPKDALYWHFRGINTGWKRDPSRRADTDLIEDVELASTFAQKMPP